MSVRTWLDSLDTPKDVNEERAEPEEARRAMPFDPRLEVSADAKYIVRRLVIWFLLVPVGIGIFLWAISR
jgi:hypothetical protein